MSVKEIKEKLQTEHSKKNTVSIAQKIKEGTYKLADVFEIIADNEPLFSQRAAWIISTLYDQNRELLASFYHELISLIDGKYHDAVLRASFRALSSMEIKENEQGLIFDKSMSLLQSKRTAIAIKIWIIDVLMNIAKPHTELQNEIKQALELQLPSASSGLKGKIVKTIQKINDNFG